MNVALWIAVGLAAAVFLAAGSLKVSKSREALQAQGLAWVEDFQDAHVKTIGTLELLGAIGLILPAAINVAPSLVLLVLVAFVAWGRFGPYAF